MGSTRNTKVVDAAEDRRGVSPQRSEKVVSFAAYGQWGVRHVMRSSRCTVAGVEVFTPKSHVKKWRHARNPAPVIERSPTLVQG